MLICIASLSALTITASAHSGRTDSKGGHWNRSTGEYHYHHGYSAHQHKDMDGDGKLDCPYEFDDNTKYSSSSQHKIDLIVPTFPEFEEPTYPEIYLKSSKTSTANEKTNKDSKDNSDSMFLISVCEFFFIISLVVFCISQNDKIQKMDRHHNYVKEQMERDFEKKSEKILQGMNSLSVLEERITSSQKRLDDISAKIAKEEQNLSAIVEEKENTRLNISRMRSAPLDISFAKDGYPIWWDMSNEKKYGDYTVFYNSKAKVFHTDYSCAPFFATETHLFKVLPEGRPCKKCAKKFEGYTIPYWFSNPK